MRTFKEIHDLVFGAAHKVHKNPKVADLYGSMSLMIFHSFRQEVQMCIAFNLIKHGVLTLEEIAQVCELPIKDVEDIDEEWRRYNEKAPSGDNY